jgi:hypothetical protein
MRSHSHDKIVELERADADQFRALLVEASSEHESALRAYLGDDRFERLRRLALSAGSKRGTVPGSRASDGDVVVLHGIMGERHLGDRQ